MPNQRQINKAKADRAAMEAASDARIAKRLANPPEKTAADRAVDVMMRDDGQADAVVKKQKVTNTDNNNSVTKKTVTKAPPPKNKGIGKTFKDRTDTIDKYSGYD